MQMRQRQRHNRLCGEIAGGCGVLASGNRGAEWTGHDDGGGQGVPGGWDGAAGNDDHHVAGV